jgi:hypothetical protein
MPKPPTRKKHILTALLSYALSNINDINDAFLPADRDGFESFGGKIMLPSGIVEPITESEIVALARFYNIDLD